MMVAGGGLPLEPDQWRRPPSIGLITSILSPTSTTRNLPRRQRRSIRPPSRARARSAGGVRSRKPNLGETVTLRTSWPPRRGPRYSQSTSSSGISGIACNLTHGLTLADASFRLRGSPAGLHNLRPGRSTDGVATWPTPVTDDAGGTGQKPRRTRPTGDHARPFRPRPIGTARRHVALFGGPVPRPGAAIAERA